MTDAGHDLSFPDPSCPHDVTAGPKLAPLGNYGGPTLTMALQAGSAATNQVPAAGAGCPATDQRGVVRPQGGACDIGAYEVAAPVCRPVAVSTHATRPVVVQLSCGDPSGLPLQYAIVHGPGHGKLSKVSGNRVTYTANSGFSGRDHFTYRATNANGAAAPQTATVTVAPAPLVISGAHLSRKRFRAGQGTKFEFTLSLAAQVKVTITHKRHGKTMTVGSISAPKRAGKDSLAFAGRIGGRILARGSYQATLIASAGRRRSKPVVLSFVVTS